MNSRYPFSKWGFRGFICTGSPKDYKGLNSLSISFLILTFNEERNLPACLEAVAWCDDIVVLDSFSTDGTVEIAKNLERMCTNVSLIILPVNATSH